MEKLFYDECDANAIYSASCMLPSCHVVVTVE